MSQKKDPSRYNLTEGSILNKLIFVALPIMGTQFMQMTYNLTDMFWLGRVSSDAVAASGTAGMFLWLSMAFAIFGRMGAEIGTSQSIGKGDKKAALGYSQNSLFLAVLLGVFYAFFLIILRKPLVGFFNIRELNVVTDTENYLAITALGIPFSYITAALTGTFNGSGNSRAPFIANACGLCCNIILDPILIFSANMGIHGAAVATTFSQGIVALMLLISIKKSKSRPFEAYRFFFKPAAFYLKQIFRWSLPISLESLFFTLLSMVISRFIAGFGAPAMAVSRVGSQIESLSWLISGGYGSALTAFVGQNYGAGKWTRIHRGFRISFFLMVGWGLIVTSVLLLGNRFLFSVFLPEPDIIELGSKYLLILAICQLPMSLELIASGAFKGCGRTVEPSIASIASNALRVPLAWYLSRTSLGVYGIFIAISAGSIFRSLWLFFWYMITSKKQPKADLSISE